MFTDWSPIKREVAIDHDLETTPLQVLTNTVVGQHGAVNLELPGFGKIRIDFRSRRFQIDRCGYHAFQNLPDSLNKEWTISKTKEALTILCNAVEVLNLVYDEVDVYCTRIWSRDVTKIKFKNDDQASEKWRPLLRGILVEEEQRPENFFYSRLSRDSRYALFSAKANRIT